jgi:glycosyltransferase involved in cell wall biosynthesis
MVSQPLISVVIPTYKRPDLVRRAINSVRNQTYRNLEVLVIDDGSADNTGSVVQSIPDPRIRYICHEANKGHSGARNTGIRAARGEYIALLDDDDEWREDKLQLQVEAIKNHDAVVCGVLVDGARLAGHSRSEVSLDDLRNYIPDPSGLLAKSSVLKETLFDESLREGEDWDVLIRIAQRHSIGYVPEPLLLYSDGAHQRVTNETKEQSGPELERRAAILHKHKHCFGDDWYRYHLARMLVSHIGSRRNKLRSIAYAIRRCGILPVAAVMVDKIRRHFRAGTVDRA